MRRKDRYPGRKKRKKPLSEYLLAFLLLGLVALIIFGGIRFFGFLWGVLDDKVLTKDAPGQTITTLEDQPAGAAASTEAGKTADKSLTGQEKDPAQGKSTEPAPALNGNVQVLPGDHQYSILIEKGEHQVYLLDKGQRVAVWPCAIGKGGMGQKIKSGDNMTPVGNFYVDEIDDASYWTHDFGDGKGVIKNAYGPWFLSLNTESVSHGKWDGIGIHGTHDPSSIGTNASEGCVRLNNENLRKLKPYVKVGTKVTIED